MSLAFGEQACRCLVSFFWFAVLLGGVGVPSLSSRHTCVALVSLVLARRAAPPHPNQVIRLALWVCLGGHDWFCLGVCVLCLGALALVFVANPGELPPRHSLAWVFGVDVSALVFVVGLFG